MILELLFSLDLILSSTHNLKV